MEKLINNEYKYMQYKFSEGLRKRLIKYFKKNYSLDVPHRTADEWLDSRADLFSVFRKINDKK
jgi:hypothetical protein